MTDLKTSIPSSESATVEAITAAAVEEVVQRDNDNCSTPEQAQDTASKAVPYVVKKPHANSKLILQNMEEVLNSVKKKHRQKHRRKKEQRKLAQMEAEAAAAVASGATGAKTVKHLGDNGHKHSKNTKRHHKKPLQEKTPQENDLHHTKAKVKHKERKSPLKGVPASSNNSILKHFQRTPKKNEDVAAATVDDDDSVEVKPPTAKPTNAFEIMMNARNRSIGSNTPGKEVPSSSQFVAEDAAAATKVKRKLLLQEWAEKKGGAKRKLEEEARATYVDKQLEQRAKRFKKMLVDGNSPKSIANLTSNEKADEKHKENDRQKQQKIVQSSYNKPEQSVGRGKRRSRRSRIPSIDSIESVVNNVDAETTEFLSKLSSPTKKRDSLLGYFPKKESPTDLAEGASKLTVNPVVETPSSRPRRSKAKHNAAVRSSDEVIANESSSALVAASTIVSTVTLSENETAEIIHTARVRLRRSCAGNARYDYDLEHSPTKLEKSTRKAIKSEKPNITQKSTNDSIELITLDDSNCDASSAPQTPLKLAPLFVRTMPKPSLDPECLRARQEFLMSGVPEKMRLEQVKQKLAEQNYEESLELFPTVSHVQQFSVEESQLLKKMKSIPENVSLRNDEVYNASEPNSASRRGGKTKARCANGPLTNCTAKDFHPTAQANSKVARLLTQHWPLPTLENKRAIIKTWKTDFERFPTYKCYNQMREKYRYFSAIDSAQDTEQVTESFVVTRRTRRLLKSQQKFDPEEEDEQPPVAAPNGELLFTEKYKPLMFEQVLVNLTPVTQLRDFLSNWSNEGSSRNSQTLADDSMDSANDSCSSQQPACHSVVLLGPGSSGKTSAVYALANEMNFNVLEINAGMKRSGKKLIQELQEATQSHQIRKEASTAQGKVQKNLLKMSLNGLKSKKAPSQSLVDSGECFSSLDLSQSARKCLILIEDADIVFEQTDAGFTDAVYTLAASSKRPVIVVATNPHCAHLQRLINQNTINFTAPNALNISRFLTVLSLMENCPVTLDDLVSLYLYNCKDLRKTLLELQFFVQSGGDQQQLLQFATTKGGAVTSSKQSQPSAQQSHNNAAFFASPNKRRFSEDPQASQPDEQLDKKKDVIVKRQQSAKQQLYMHRTLFEFYTVAQNDQCRIPFPVDFRLLRSNLHDLLQVARKLKVIPVVTASSSTSKTIPKRKSRSPKKAWLNSVKASSKAKLAITPLDALCDFYEHISVATLLSARDENSFVRAEGHTELHFADGLVPHLAEQISHTIVEQTIEVNLAADACPYNLFDTPQEIQTVCDNLGAMTLRTQSARCLDYEPALRAICRSEKRRATLERRSTRFYHYLRNSSVHPCTFSMQYFDAACDILQEPTCASNEQSESKSQT